MKKIISVILALVLLLNVFSISTFAEQKEQTVRYTVLVLDTSGSNTFTSKGEEIYTADTAIEYMKKASSRFLDNISEAAGDNYVAVVSYRGYAELVSDFSKDYDSIKNDVNYLYADGGVKSISRGLEKADEIMSEIEDEDAIKNVVLFTTGMTNEGEYSYTGRYDENTVGSSWYRTDTEIKLYAYSNVAYEWAKKISDKGINLYTIGLFQTMENMPEKGKDIAEFFELVAKDLATSEEYFYRVDNPDDLEFTFGEVAEDIINELKEITFDYQSGNVDFSAKCYYTDDYFAKSSYEYDTGLSTMSLSLAMSAYGSGADDPYSNKSINVRTLMERIGIHEDNIVVNDWFTKKPTTDSIGVAAGNKPIKVNGEDYTLIVVAIRGGGYESEWASNFTIGSVGEHQGFSEAKGQVILFLNEYIANQNIEGPVKIWITGFSRAAATANLVGGQINVALEDGLRMGNNKITYNFDDVYTYCFETPAGALASEVYGRGEHDYNIKNIINPCDPVPYVAPATLGFARYGRDIYLPSPESSPSGYNHLKEKMLEIYDDLENKRWVDYKIDDFQMKKIGMENWLPGGEEIAFIVDDTDSNLTQGVYLSEFIDTISREFLIDRNHYVDEYQNNIRNILSLLLGCTEQQQEDIIASIGNNFEQYGGIVNLLLNRLHPYYGDEVLELVSEWVMTALSEAGVVNYDRELIDTAVREMASLLFEIILSHPNYSSTMQENMDSLLGAHDAELCYAWLASFDKNYDENAESKLNNGNYRIVRINCEVDIEVVDKNGNVVAAIVDEQPMDMDNAYVYGIDEDGQKYVVLPIDSEYVISIKAREDDLVNCSVNEYCASMGSYTRIVNYFDMELDEGEEITAIIPSYSEEEITGNTLNGSEADYKVINPDGDVIESDSDKSGKEALEDKFTVTATSSNVEYGMVFGSGSHHYGEFALVEAVAFEGYKFAGWYENDVLVSEESFYRICVKNNIELVAKFETAEAEKCEHNNVEIINAKDATCQQEGYTGDTYCKDCEQIIEVGKVIGMSDHDMAEATCTEPRTCKVCGTTEGETLGHDYGPWVTVEEPTETEGGRAVKTCKRCGQETSKYIKPINRIVVSITVSGEKEGNESNPNTGATVCSGSAFAAIAVLAAAAIVLKKINKK